ncbi:unnamed protein product [Closterium sp. Yama58-4]|nr:unnamed protein product [Closterium sp. Yama58-4]
MRQQNVMGNCMPKSHDDGDVGRQRRHSGLSPSPLPPPLSLNPSPPLSPFPPPLFVAHQLTTTAVWVANVVIPGSAIFASRMSAIGAPVAMSYGGVKGVVRMTRGPDAVIARKTMEKRALVAMLTAAHARRLDKKGGAVGIFSPKTQNKPARYQQFRQHNQVSTQMATRVADVTIRAVRKDKAAVNIEDLAKYDPSGTLPMLVAYSHPLCSKNECAKCSVTANPCIAGNTCNSGKCGNPIIEPDGTSCVDSDYQGNTFPGFCQSGTCHISAVQSYYGSAQKTSMWLPEGVSLPTLPELKISVSRGLAGTNGSAEGFVGRSIGFWHRLSRQSRSCTFNNGGCGVFACRVDYKRRKTACVNPKKMGFAAAPMGIDFPLGATISYSFPTAPARCMQRCKKMTTCVLAVTTVGRECWLKSSAGNVTVNTISFQAYKKL